MNSVAKSVESCELWIREIHDEKELTDSVAVIRAAFATVARDLNLTEENAPTNPAFLKLDGLQALREKGLYFFGCFLEEKQVGFIAIEKASPELYYLEKVAVLPAQRHQGIGKKLLDFGFCWAGGQGGQKISIALINENQILKQWYSAYGFRETGLKRFPHLPFTVCFMERAISA